MSKARVSVKGTEVVRIINLQVQNERSNKQTSKTYYDGVRKLSNQLVGLGRGHSFNGDPNTISAQLRADMVTQLNHGTSTILSLLKTGIKTSTEPGPLVDGRATAWGPLSKRWIRKKRKESKGLYWRNIGNLSNDFNKFSTAYSKRMLQSEIHITPHKTVVGKPFKYKIQLKLPRHKSDVMNQIIALSFADASDYSNGEDLYDSNPGRLAFVLGLLETSPGSRSHRPFMSAVMANRGRRFQDNLQATIRKAADNTTRGAWLRLTYRD
jgi:hypothetical protein